MRILIFLALVAGLLALNLILPLASDKQQPIGQRTYSDGSYTNYYDGGYEVYGCYTWGECNE